MANKPYIIGLTGNIACGKSAVAAMLAELGAEVVDADQLVHLLMEPGTDSWKEIVRRFGDGVVGPEGRLDRRRIGEIVFRDAAALADLEAILHPATRRLAEERIAASVAPAVVLEAIKLIEAGWTARVASVWVVVCPREQQVERLMATRGMTRDEAALRVDAQSPASEKVKHADVVIDNAGSIAETRTQVRSAWDRLVGI